MNKTFIIDHYKKLFLAIFLVYITSVSSQVGINTSTPDASSVLDLSSTSKGLLAPTMTTTQRLAIVNNNN